MVRGKQRPGGVMMVAINLMKGLDRLGVAYRFNDFNYIKKHPAEIACIIGKPQLLFERKWKNPVIFGAGIYSHPIESPDLLKQFPVVKRVLVPGEWMRQMFEPYYGSKVISWPTGIDTDRWSPRDAAKEFDFLIYDKVRWDYEKYDRQLIQPMAEALKSNNLSCQYIKYGNYHHGELMAKLETSKAVIFLCEHETQGLAYQQILATNTPVFAWDRESYWVDPYYYPHKVQFTPTSSVPYWDERCGLKFKDLSDFKEKLSIFQKQLSDFKPREYILENLTLELCAQKYLDIYRQVQNELN
jgi:glycosyltransferase involved in cell wall biosynthesis